MNSFPESDELLIRQDSVKKTNCVISGGASPIGYRY